MTSSPCDSCQGKCCRYFILDYQRLDMSIPLFRDTLDWISRHHDTSILKQDLTKRWARIQISNPCTCLDGDGRCKDYEDRPLTCRKYVCDKMREAIIEDFKQRKQ